MFFKHGKLLDDDFAGLSGILSESGGWFGHRISTMMGEVVVMSFDPYGKVEPLKMTSQDLMTFLFSRSQMRYPCLTSKYESKIMALSF